MSFAQQAQLPTRRSIVCRNIRLFLFVFRQPKKPRLQAQVFMSKSQVQEPNSKFKNQVTSPRNKKRPKSRPIASQPQKRFKTHEKEAKNPISPATNMTTTRSQSLAMSSPQAVPAPQQPESPESIPAQEESLSPEWVHAITNL